MQTMEYQINSNRVSNGQTPFVTVGFGLGTDWFSREIQRAILLNRIRGLGKEHHTAIFPKLVFTVKHGVNADPGDPNYDLKQLALESATKRMYPDVVFYENIVKITGSFKAPMGCVDGNETVTWSDGDRQYNESFKAMWSHMVQRYGVERQQTGNPDDFVVELDDKPILIKDSYSGKPEFVKVRRIIKNASRRWLRVTFEDGQTIDCTPDHPFPIENYPGNKGRTRVAAFLLKPGYEIPLSGGEQGTTVIKSVVPVELDEPSYDVTTESDHFDCSGIVSHNCRSFLQGWENPDTGKDEEDGRMNLGVVTVNVPRIAIESHGDKARFWKLFNERMEVAHQALQFRIMRCKEATPVNAPTLFR
ncbi:anaerobic ribonucleoside-triphosphate reductase, partial [Bifidobacterium callitrichidarum]